MRIMLEEGISYPFKGDSSLGRNVIGSLLLAFFWLFIPLFAFFGYIVRVLRTTTEGAEEPPSFDNWGEMLVDGLKGFAVFVAYGAIPYALLFVVMAVVGVGESTAGAGTSNLVAGVGAIGFLWVLAASVIVQYIVPAALTNFAREGELTAAFDLGTIASVIFSVEYFVAWLLPIVIYVLLYIVAIFLAFTVVGILLLPWLYFYGSLVVYRMFGQAYVSVLDLDSESESAVSAATVE